MSCEGPEELCAHVRKQLPLRARLIGKERLNDLVLIAVQEWPSEQLLSGSTYHELALEDARKTVARTYEALHGADKRYGILWEFVVSAVISAILQHIFEWWWERSVNRVRLVAWQQSMRKR